MQQVVSCGSCRDQCVSPVNSMIVASAVYSTAAAVSGDNSVEQSDVSVLCDGKSDVLLGCVCRRGAGRSATQCDHHPDRRSGVDGPRLSGKFILPDATCRLTGGGGRTLHKCRCCGRCVLTKARGFAGRKILGKNVADQLIGFRRVESSRTLA